MKKIYILFTFLLGTTLLVSAQNTVTADANATFLGYANVFELDGTTFAFGQGWGVPELKTVVDATAGTITLQPNFNTYGDNLTDPFWVNQTTGAGNKIFQASTFVEETSLAGAELTFTGGVSSYSLDAGYTAIAFIKVFNVDFSVLKEETAPLVAGQDFSVIYTNVEPGDTTVQYGWTITGVNANPLDETALGNIVVVETVLSTNDFDATSISSFPNPVANNWNVTSKEAINTISLVNVLGQEVMNVTPAATNYTLDMSGLTAGVYLAKVVTFQGEKTIKLIKK